ncbi:MAG: NAD(+) synthase [Eubacteriales bacterium]|nr:NAD(+) synthase [Eubacteriales bacterium]
MKEFGLVTVAAAGIQVRLADPRSNAQQVIARLDEVEQAGAKVAVFPELTLSGYSCGDLFLQKSLLDQCLRALDDVIVATKGRQLLVAVGLPFADRGNLYNTMAMIFDGRLLGLVPKSHIPNHGEFYEARYFTGAAQDRHPVNVLYHTCMFGADLLFINEAYPDMKVACEICEDLWLPSSPSVRHALAGATLILNASASNEVAGKQQYRRLLLQAHSAKNVVAYVYANAGEGESTTDLVFGGGHLIAENGHLLVESERFSGELAVAQLDIEQLMHERRRLNTLVGTGDEGYWPVSFCLPLEEEVRREYSRLPFVPQQETEQADRFEEILQMQAMGLVGRLRHIGAKHSVIGVSGGLDSTLALLVIARAYEKLGWDKQDIIAVTMPCFGTTGRTYRNARRLAEVIGASLREINIAAAVTQHFSDIGQALDRFDVTYENGQARERTQVLMDVANQIGGIVIGTGDLSELALGWATYNGDHMSMYGVNASIPKTLVRRLVAYEAKRSRNEELRQLLLDVCDTPVSPELLPADNDHITQKTEDLVGPYELHDFFLYHFVRNGFGPTKIYAIAKKSFAGAYEDEVILHWLATFFRRFFSQQFKRSCLPDGVKVGSVGLSPRGDWRMPSDASWQLWQRELESLT